MRKYRISVENGFWTLRCYRGKRCAWSVCGVGPFGLWRNLRRFGAENARAWEGLE